MVEIVKLNEAISVTSEETAVKSRLISKKHVLAEAPFINTARVYVALSYEYSGAGRRSTDFEPLKPREVRLYDAPEKKLIHWLWYYSETGTQYLNYFASDAPISRVESVCIEALPITGYVPSSARNVSGNSGTIDATRWQAICLFLDITAVSGTTPTLDVALEGLDPQSNSWFTLYAFPQKTAVGKDNRSIGIGFETGKILPPSIRVAWTIGGTTPSFTFSVGMIAEHRR